MVIAKLSGGLGNQMFQYACAIAVAEHLECECKFDLDWFDYSTLHNGLEIHNVFGVELPRATPLDVKAVLGWRSPIIMALGPRILSEKISFFTRKLMLTEHAFSGFIEKRAKKGGDVYMAGYWQSEDYFLDKKKVICSAFQFIDTSNANEYENKIINSRHPVSMHIRRGDYVTDKKSNDLLGVCSINYYRQAAKDLENRLDETPTYFVFSDDLNWAKEQLDFLENIVFVEGNEGAKSYLDMYLMSLCEHHVIANSSFSWWGAWLALSKNKIVYAPSPWFNQGEALKSICPSRWLLMDKNIKGSLAHVD